MPVKATQFFGAWLSLVERFVRDEEVARSNRVAPICAPPQPKDACSRNLIRPRGAFFA